MSLRSLDIRSKIARKSTLGSPLKEDSAKERRKAQGPKPATLQVDPAPVGNAMPYNGAGQPVGRSVDAIQSERKEEALDIVDQMLAGAQPTRMQLMTIKTELMKGQEHWLTEGDEQWLKDSLMQLVMSKVPRAPAIVKAMPHGTTPAACYAPQLRVLFARSINWEVPISEIDKVCDELGLFDLLGLDTIIMRKFILRIEQGYQDCPYHNKMHAATVTLMHFQILLHSGVAMNLERKRVGDAPASLYVLAAIVAASVHDVHHPGVGSDFRVRTADEASLKYHDQSVNENDHLAHALEIIKETQVFGTLDAEAQRIIRSVIIDMVLRTDMCVHFDVLHKFKAVSARKKEDEETTVTTLAFFLKCADLGHCTFPWEEHLRWFKMLEEEYHQQGDLEKALSLTFSSLTDREKSMGPTQAKFLEVLVIPMYRELANAFPATKHLLQGVLNNRNCWVANKSIVDAPVQASGV